MRDVDMSDQVVVVTGANVGIGRATAKALARMGATVFASGRRRDALDEAVRDICAKTGNDRVVPLVADLSSQREVRDLAAQIRDRTERLDVLIHNAGIATDRRTETVDGLELCLAVNHLAPFLLTAELLPLLRASAPSRIVTVSSAVHTFVKTLDLDDLQSRRRYEWMEVYSKTKLANVLFTRELARRLEGTGITANCLHPGVIRTHFGADGDLHGFNRLVYSTLRFFLPGPDKGARTSVYLAASPEVAETSGGYFDKSRPKTPSALAQDDALAKRLWEVSEELVGLA